MKALNLLLQAHPQWVQLEQRRYDSALISVAPPTARKSTSREYRLELRETGRGGVCVLEQDEHRQLPEFCIERHINDDGTFCMFLDSGAKLDTSQLVTKWWAGLADFLNNQAYAEKYQLWPLHAGLSHGRAAYEQLAMEELAGPLGWKDDLLKAIFRGKGWLATNLPSIGKRTGQILNSRSSCPRGCTWKHRLLRKKSCETDSCYIDCKREHKPILRTNCPHRDIIEEIIAREHRRRKLEYDMVNQLKEEGAKCCGTMKKCPLRGD